MTLLIEWFLPKTDNRTDRARAMLVVTTCGAVMLASLAMLIFWIVTGSLEETATIVADVVLLSLLFGIILLARRGKTRLALWVLIGLLALLILGDSASYGIGTLTSTAFLIPIILAASGAGFWAGLMMALLGSAGMWAIALASSSGALQTGMPVEASRLTFDAPFLTILFFLIAVILGVWGREMEKQP